MIGSRAIRYEGKDEAYAVNELYQKLKEEIMNQKARQQVKSQWKKQIGIPLTATIIIVILTIILAFAILMGFSPSPRRGYYKYNNNYYYYQLGSWYVYNDYLDDWSYSYSTPENLKDNYSDYYRSSDYNYYYGTSNFKDSSYYESDPISTRSDWDSGSSWSSSDSWDSGSTDWSSDW